MGKIKTFDSFNEAIITQQNYSGLKEDIIKNLKKDTISIDELKSIGDKYSVMFLSYDEFYEDLQEGDKSTAPPRGRAPLFGFHNAKHNKSSIVLDFVNQDGVVNLGGPFINMVEEMLEHESIHKEQDKRSVADYRLPDPKDSKGYFSDKNEIMAFSQTLARSAYRQYKSGDKLSGYLYSNPLYNHIKSVVDEKTLKRYHKYVYLYIKQMQSS